jgi:hypothetical protein
VQKGLLSGSYGLPRGRFRAWYRAKVPADADVKAQGLALAAVHYNGLTQHMLVDAPAELLAALTADDPDAFTRLAAEGAARDRTKLLPETLDRTDPNPHVARFLKESPGSYGLKMLLHDWSQDPALWQRPDALARVRAAQLAGIARLRAGVPADAITKAFVVESGLYEIYAASIGMAP